jgi:MFS family permease
MRRVLAHREPNRMTQTAGDTAAEPVAPPPPRPRPASRSLNAFRALQRHRNFRLFWIGQTVSLVGTWMQTVAQGWLALELSNDPFTVGIVAASGSLPVALFSLVGGVIADRYDKLKLVLTAQTLLALQAGAFWLMVATGHISIGWVVALALFGGLINAFEIPARQSFIIELVGREDLLDAIALNSTGFNLARILGPMVAGLLIANFGLPWVFGVNAISYAAVLAGLLLIRLPPRRIDEPKRTSPMSGLMEGLRYVRRTEPVWNLMKLIAVFSIFGAPYLALMPVTARDTLGGDARTYGWLLGAVGCGAIMGGLVLAIVARRAGRGRVLTAGALSFGALVLAFSLSRSLALSLVLLLFVGFTMVLTNAISNGLLQTLVPDALRGRVMAAYAWVFVGVGPVLGPYLVGGLANRIGTPQAIGASAAVTLLYGMWAFARYPVLRRM